MSRQTIAVSVKASKLTARALAYVVAAVGRKIAKEHRKAQTPHGKQSVRKLMGHGGDTNAIEVDTPKLFDKVARKWGVDYAIRRVGDQKYLLLFKARQADAITGCFAEYSRLELKRAKSRQPPIREQLRQAEEQVKKAAPAGTDKGGGAWRQIKSESMFFRNIPYLFIGWFCLKIGTAYRLAAGTGFGEKLLGLGQTIGAAFASFAPGLAPAGLVCRHCGSEKKKRQSASGFLIYCEAKKKKKLPP